MATADKLEQLGIGSEVRELKIGSSFDKNSGSTFHTVRYDFKPASVDPSKMGVLEMGESNSVTVTVPHMNGTGVTNFNGHAKEGNKKECVLIINHETGEITLEKISSQMLLKKTRPEKPEKSSGPILSSAPPASSNSMNHQKNRFSKNSHATFENNSPKSNHYNSGKGSNGGGIAATRETLEDMDENSMPTSLFDLDDFGGGGGVGEPAKPPIKSNSSSSSSAYSKSNNAKSSSTPQQQQQPQQVTKPPSRPPVLPKTNVGGLSDSSSSDSSSESDSDSDDFEEVKSSAPPPPAASSNGNGNLMSMPSFSTSPPRADPPPPTKRNGTPSSGVASMPALSLSDDLQLSESDDSD